MYVLQSPARQTPQEAISYAITTTPWGSAPTDISMIVWDVTGGGEVNVTSTTTEDSISVLGDVITTKRVKSLTLGRDYRVDVLFTDSNNNVWEAQVKILCRAT